MTEIDGRKTGTVYIRAGVVQKYSMQNGFMTYGGTAINMYLHRKVTAVDRAMGIWTDCGRM